MTRYQAMFEALGAKGEGALGAFLMAGDPGLERCHQNLDALVSGGADMIELGIPFTDPVADGPIIQASATRALQAGVRPADCFNLIAQFRARWPVVPIGVLTYANIVAARGIAQFMRNLAHSGADSILVADVPAFEAAPYADAARAAGIDLIMIAATNTPMPTLEQIARLGSGYTYCVSRPGVTGADQRLRLKHGNLFHHLERLKAAPPILGFGISNPAQVLHSLAEGARGVIVGSALVAMVERGCEPEELARSVASLKLATVTAKSSHYSVSTRDGQKL